MTTAVEITACCDPAKKEVEITVTDGDKVERTIIQDGESKQDCVYDERTITVRELAKETGD